MVNKICGQLITNKGVFLCSFLLFAISSHGVAQAPNSWIDFTQSYYKIPVSKDGIYKISYSDLENAGFPV